MPITAARERELLNHYKITSLYPTEWPLEDEADESDEDEDLTTLTNATLNPSTTAQSGVDLPSSAKPQRLAAKLNQGGHGKKEVDKLVQKDEPDPLGILPSVAAELRAKAVPIEDNVQLRNRFMLSSTTFSPTTFLANVHRDASVEDLLQGLDFLSRSIEQKSASLKILVESNFEKFVRAKATIDNVYTEMRMQGQDAEELQPPLTPSRRPHSRHTSRNSMAHFRGHGTPFGSTSKAQLNPKKKTALTKESEFGVQGVRMPLQELSIRAEEIWGPALGVKDKEGTLKSALSALDQHADIVSLGGSISEAIRKNDYESILEEYRKANKHAAEARMIAEISQANSVALGDADVQQIILTARMWHDVSAQLDVLKRDLWRRLRSCHPRRSSALIEDGEKELHMELIATLLQLNVDENPIWVWLSSRYLYLKDKITRTFERARIEIEIARRRLTNDGPINAKEMAVYLRSAVAANRGLRKHIGSREHDKPAIVAFWEKVDSSITSMLSTKHGLLGEVLEHWETAQSFIENKAQKAFPSAVFAVGFDQLSLDQTEVQGIQAGAAELAENIRDNVLALFSDPPVQDLSDLYSPIPNTPSSVGELTPSISRTYMPDPSTIPPPSPLRGDMWEKFAFWPPHSNSLSAGHYLSRIATLVGTAASELSAMSVMQDAAHEEALKSLVNTVRERSIQAVCAAWTTDAERCKFMEMWQRDGERRELTTMPLSFLSFEEKVLQSVQQIAYLSEVVSVKSGAGVILPPPAKLLQAVRGSLVTSLYKTLSGMVENAERTRNDGSSDYDVDGITIPLNGSASAYDETGEIHVDAKNKNIRTLMTLSNLAYLRTDIIPQLVSQFETSFSVKLTEESKTIRDVLSQIDSRLFQAYVKPTADRIQEIVSAGIADPSWIPSSSTRPDDARPYIYQVLLTLVLVHSEVSTTAVSLTPQIISHLLEQSSTALIAAFRTRQHYSLVALMQATLDVEFMAQTLNNFTTERAGEVQSQIYLALDERTDDDARKRLQSELPEMRNILKRLRENTKGEFGCFKKERRGRERGGTTASGGR